ncbi:MAG: LCP family protein [Dorea sp.]|nr:LCP family protein [Dorea sp.]
MKYRDQLRYIKNHQNESERKRPRRRGGRKERKRAKRKSAFGRLLWTVQMAASLFFVAAMAILGILPRQYLAGLALLLLALLFVVRALSERARRSRRRRGSGKGLSAVLSALLIVGGIYGLKVNAALDKIAVGEESGSHAGKPSYSVTEQPFNVYISGIDVYGDIDQESRSDVNLIATINPKENKILLTTTPRDYYVPIPGVSGGERDKLTHAGNYGVGTSMETLEELYNTEIPFYVRVNFTSVEEIVDVMGGVDVESELAFQTGKEAGEIVDVKEGKNHFNGKQALAFVRERKALAAGDNQRGKNQQALLAALIKKCMSPMILRYANGMINSVAGNAETNLSENQIKSLIQMQIGGMKGWEIESVAASGDDSGKKYCYSYRGGPLYVTVPDEGSVEEIKNKMEKLMEN